MLLTMKALFATIVMALAMMTNIVMADPLCAKCMQVCNLVGKKLLCRFAILAIFELKFKHAACVYFVRKLVLIK